MRVGFLSGVRHADSYLRLLARDPRVTLVGVGEDTDAPEWMRADSAAVAESFGLPLMTTDELLAAGCDLLVVCSEPTRHAALALRALEAGVNVLVDKPVAVNLDEVDALIAAEARSTGRVAVVNRLHSPAVRRLRKQVDAGHFGLPRHVDVEWFASGAFFSTSVERPELVVDTDLSGGGELLNFLLYPVDYVRYLTGLEVVDVYAEASTLFQDAHREAGVEDTAVVSLLLEHGVTSTITLGRVVSAPGHGPVSSSIRLLGSRGFSVSDDDKPAISVYDRHGGHSQRPIGGPSSTAIVEAFLADLVGDLAAGRAPSYGLSDARASLEVTRACIASAQTARSITLSAVSGEE